MSVAPFDAGSPRRPLRLWPGVVIVTLQWLSRFGLPLVAPEASMWAILGGLAGGVALVVWWLFFSRAPWSERLGGLALMAAAVAATPLVLHESVATGGMGMLFYLYVMPPLCLAFVVWAALSRRLATGPRWAAMAGAIVLACGGWALVRTGGFTGYGDSDFAWRWSMTEEERLVAQAAGEPVPRPPAADASTEAAQLPASEGAGEPAADESGGLAGAQAAGPGGEAAEAVPAGAAGGAGAAEAATAGETAEDSAATAAGADSGLAGAASPATTAAAPRGGGSELGAADATAGPAVTAPGAAPSPVAPAGWPGFRGPSRDGVVRAAPIATDWTASPPVELWRRPVGPGWSSFAVGGGRVYTQEQRGEEEVVGCYDAATGEPVWRHADPVRFWESNAGAGPRATPTLAGGRLYTLGGTGLVNALDAATGAVIWSRDAAADTGAKLPTWGFSGSPLAIGDLVVVAASGALIAYDRDTGERRWTGPAGGEGYSSPQRATIGGVEQIVQVHGAGIVGVAPADGAALWEHAWKGYPIVQPALPADGDVLLAVDADSGVRRLAVARGADGWSVEERWTSRGLKPYFNDFVVHEGHAYGFDGGILAAIRLDDGERRWKGGRYGHGQIVLLPDQDLLLVLGESGELALVRATADGFAELARRPAIEGKTWNHPVIAGDLLLVRNDREMAAFRLPAAGGS